MILSKLAGYAVYGRGGGGERSDWAGHARRGDIGYWTQFSDEVHIVERT